MANSDKPYRFEIEEENLFASGENLEEEIFGEKYYFQHYDKFIYFY